MRWITFLILLYLMYAMQVAHLGAIPHVHGGDWPGVEYLVVLAVFYGLFAAESAAPFCGLICGICYDLSNDQVIGTAAVPLAVVAWLIVQVRLSIFREHFASQILLTLMAMVVFAVLSIPMHWITGAAFEGLSAWRHFGAVAGDGVYTAVVSPVLFWVFFRFQPLLGFSAQGPRVRGHG